MKVLGRAESWGGPRPPSQAEQTLPLAPGAEGTLLAGWSNFPMLTVPPAPFRSMAGNRSLASPTEGHGATLLSRPSLMPLDWSSSFTS